MDVDVLGRVANVKLGRSRCLQPLFEAIINSIHAIEEAKTTDGRIEVRIERDQTQKTLVDDDAASFPVSGFVVTDNGIGFTDKHFQSFCTSDTTEKRSRGGKGVGRFLWLKAFQQAEVASVFRSNGSMKKREFLFSLSGTGITPNSAEPVACDKSSPETVVRLTGFRAEYQRHCPKGADAIANRIVEHFLELFILKKCPKLVLVDDVEKTRIDLNRRFTSEMKLGSKTQKFSIRGLDFRLSHVRLAAAHAQQHTLNFCAHGRTVRSESLAKLLPYLERTIPGEADEPPFVYSGYVSGKFLDESVMSERTQFDIAEERAELEFPDELSWPELMGAAVEKTKAFLAPSVEPLNNAKRERIRVYVQTKAPQFRHLLRHCRSELDQLPANLTDEKLDLELYKLDQQHDAVLRARYDKLLAMEVQDAVSYDDQRRRFEEFLEDWNEAGMAKLARHVAHRKATLEFLERRLEIQDDGNYAREEAVHEVIFPLKATSDEVRSDQMNLWILDEKLAFHFYLASDKRLDQMGEAVEVDSSERPDIAIFGNPFAFVDTSPTFGSVVLVEFKRPARDDYSDKEEKNPIQQIYGYVKQMRSGRAKDRKGRPIPSLATTPFYAYIVCDLTPKLEDQAVYAQLTKTPDGLGYFGYNSQVGVYIEIISFAKLIADAKKRNAAFFEKLGLGR